jgi:hypothetical protein
MYLLASIFFSLIIPLQLFSVVLPFSSKPRVIRLEEIMIKTDKAVLDSISYSNVLMYFLSLSYFLIVAILVVRFIRNIFSFYFRIKRNRMEIVNGQKVVLTKEQMLPHSFWNRIFINDIDFDKGKIPAELLAHETAHLKQKHTLDILFIEILQIVFWFNPLFVFFKKAIKLNHEFLADEAVNEQFGAVQNYQNMLLNFASDKNNIALASNINYLITKKRFLMMSKNESQRKVVLKVFSVGVVYALVFLVFSTDAVAQKVTNKAAVKEKDLYTIEGVEELPEYPGGIEAFYKFVGENFRMPKAVGKNKIEGKTYMKFIIEKDGSLTDIITVKDAGYGIGDEVMRVLKLSPKWTAAKQQGKSVRVMYSLPITVRPEM